jgi:hypothetical protein
MVKDSIVERAEAPCTAKSMRLPGRNAAASARTYAAAGSYIFSLMKKKGTSAASA